MFYEKNILLLYFGKLSSVMGSSVYTFAIGLYILSITGSGLSFSVNIALSIVPVILISPFAGVVADRFNKKTVIVAMDMLSAAAMMFLYIFSLRHELSVSAVYTATFFMAVINTAFSITIESLIPEIVKPDKLIGVNSVSRIIDSASGILGPVLGGVVFAFVDIRLFILINAASFFISALSEMFIEYTSREINHNADESVKVQIRNAAEYIWGYKEVLRIFAALVFLNFSLGLAVNVPLPYILNTVLKIDPAGFGFTQSFVPIGIITGALAVQKLMERIDYSRLLLRVSLVLGVLMSLLGLPVIPAMRYLLTADMYVPYYSIILFFMGICISLIDIPLIYKLQTSIDEAMRGRVLSIGITIAKIVLPAALILSGLLINVVPIYTICIFGGLILIMSNFLVFKGYSKI